MRARLFVLFVCAGLMAPCLPVLAHHSFDAEFNEKDRITLKGTLTKMEWMNPHCWIYLDVKDPGGKVSVWAVETGAPMVLLSRGLRKDDFRVGMELVIDGYRAKTKAATAAGRIVTLTDGTQFFIR